MKLSKSLISIWVPMIFESRYCLTNGPNVQKRSNIIVQFTSDDSITRTGAQCTTSCIEDSPSPPPSPLCMFGYDSVCLSSKSTDLRSAYCPSVVDIILNMLGGELDIQKWSWMHLFAS